MNIHEIESFLLRFCQAYHCEITNQTPCSLTCKLSIEADKMITNRLFYWNFVERLSLPAEPLQMTLVFNPYVLNQEVVDPSHDDLNSKREQLTMGSPCLERLFHAVKQSGRLTQCFEHVHTPLFSESHEPQFESWLNCIIKVEYICDRKKSKLFSYGIQLQKGHLQENFYTILQSRQISTQIPNGLHLPRTHISLGQAVEILESHLEDKIKQENQSWAQQAHQKWLAEIQQIKSYYQLSGNENNHLLKCDSERPDLYKKRLEELSWQYKPRIRVSILQAGIFHLLATQNHSYHLSHDLSNETITSSS